MLLLVVVLGCGSFLDPPGSWLCWDSSGARGGVIVVVQGLEEKFLVGVVEAEQMAVVAVEVCLWGASFAPGRGLRGAGGGLHDLFHCRVTRACPCQAGS